MEVYSTHSVPRSARTSYWNDVYSSRFARVTFDPADRDDFAAELKFGSIGPMRIARIRSMATAIERTDTDIDHSAERLFSFVLQARGSGRFSHYGHDTLLEQGDFTLCDSAAPHRLQLSKSSKLVILRASPELLRLHLPFPEQMCGRRLPANRGLTGTAAALTRTLWDQMEAGTAEAFGATIVRHLLDVMATSYAMIHQTSIADSSIVCGRKVQVKEFIETHLRESDLGPALIAKALKLSPRYLRMLMSDDDEKISNYILRRRLEECAKQISNLLWRGHTITEIAFAWGFNSSAHFTRAFRDQYDMTPSAYRHLHTPH